ncbi:hypothetical protein OKW21_002146 [Catalinimonas alkaloidigena]|uniref:hypothetical protein n=1 Tax=Catalinimonas alkaloidigena TaxID=1075417 RepID=UPI002404EB60|nr:hypothetical protein [Catalinimonas alkaloidigena]MDF9796883.1 hypothetical protein [Catalinimonas alkaloidigena]
MRITTSLLHSIHLLAVLFSLLLILLLSGHAMAQSKKDKLPTVKISKHKKEPVKVKPVRKPKKIKDTYSRPKTSDSNAKPRDNYRRPASLKKAKRKVKYQRPASKPAKFDNSGHTANQYPRSPAKDGQHLPKRSLWQRLFRPNAESEFEGKLKRKKKEGAVGTEYALKVKQHKTDYEQIAKDQHLFQGKIKRAPHKMVKRQFQYKAEYMFLYTGAKKVYRPKRQEKKSKQHADYVQTIGMYKVKKEKNKAAGYTSYQGQIKVPTLKVRTSHYKKLSEKVHQFDGDIRYRKPGKDMHPSVFHLKGKTKSSYEQKEKYRRWRLIISHIFKQNDLPKNIKEKDRKPRYDKKESEIWYY